MFLILLILSEEKFLTERETRNVVSVDIYQFFVFYVTNLLLSARFYIVSALRRKIG